MDFAHGFEEALHRFHQGEIDEALALCESLIGSHGERGDTLNLAALCHTQRGDQPEAESLLRRAVAAAPDFAPAWSNLGNHLRRHGQESEGVAALERALAADPACIEAWNNLGLAALDAGELDTAEHRFRRALAINPDYAVSLYNLARVQLMRHAAAEAEATLHHLLAVTPAYPSARACLGSCLVDQGRLDEAEGAYRDELHRDPANRMALNNLGLLTQQQRRLEEARALFEQATAYHPGDALLLTNHANVLREVGQPDAAAARYRAAAEADPTYGTALAKWMLSARTVCDWTDLPEIEERIVASIEAGRQPMPAPFDLLIHPTLNGAHHRRVAKAYAAHIYGAALAQPELTAAGVMIAPAGGPLRIGYVSSDYYEHATMRLLAGVLSRHDPAQVEFVCYSTGAHIGEAERQRIESAPACRGFRDVARLSDQAAAECVRHDHIDLLIDLKGYTQENRLGIQALRPAPVVVSWLGYPGTLGDPRLADYIIGDPLVTPLASQPDYSECLALMPHCYQPNDDTLQPAAPPSRHSQGLPEEGLVLCNFNSTYKFSPASFRQWMRLLHDIPGSVLWLLGTGDQSRARLVKAAAGEGVAADRLVFAAAMSQRDHVARLQLADIALDTFPYTSHTTGSDALLAGVPLVTKLGDTFASRVAASLLHAVGLPELVVPDDAAAHALTLALARDDGRRHALRQHLLGVRRSCPLFDTAGFTRDLERLYHEIARQQRCGERQAFALPASDNQPGAFRTA